jgi:adenylate cyclase
MKLWKNALIGLGAALVFSILYITGVLLPLEDKVYDLFLRFRANRERINNVVFLDVDDNAIAYNGVFPWPRSITADGLLRLKEYGARAAIFDIEYQDNSPQGVDSVYLQQNLPADFAHSFSSIESAAQDMFSALGSGRLNRADIGDYAAALSEFIGDERDSLFSKAQGIVRNNDLYLAQASALFGKSWSTLNLRSAPLDGELAERRPMAEELFSYPVQAAADAHHGPFVDVLPALPSFSRAAKGAGFTNVEIDEDGIRRRIYLAQNIYDHWYLQLAFAPLIDYLGAPEIVLNRRELLMKGAHWEGGRKDIRIPLDSGGRMMLDWPRENYTESYRHISFADFSLLETIETELEQYSRGLGVTEIPFFAQFDPSLAQIPRISGDLADLFDAVTAAKTNALENCSDVSFDAYVEYRARSRVLIGEILALDPAAKVQALALELGAEYPESAAAIADEAGYIAALAENLAIDLARYGEISKNIDEKVRDNFCVLGRVDTGTTDIGVNPFWGEYVNVGTHAVVLDTILSESFIVPLSLWWSVFFTVIFVPVFFFFTMKLGPLPRAVLGFAVTALIAVVTILMLRFTGVFFGPLGTLLAMISAVIIREITSYAGSEQEKRFIKSAFSQYLSPKVIEQIIADPSQLRLGGEKREMSAIFTDIRSFSTISEALGDPVKLVELLNYYLTRMSDIVLENQGTIDKYEGDAIIAFFGAPVHLENHASLACRSAIKMKKAEVEINREVLAQGLITGQVMKALTGKGILKNIGDTNPIFTRLGVNTGDMVVGNMGTPNKMDYTIMGNAVNLAARLEGVNKQYDTGGILISEYTRGHIGDEFILRPLSRVRVVGINTPLRLYELLDIREEAPPELIATVKNWEQGFAAYESQDFASAQNFFHSVYQQNTSDMVAQKYLARCTKYLAAPPNEVVWDNGVDNLTEK